MRGLLLAVLCLCPIFTFSQDKYEREYRLQAEEVPALARSFVDSCQFDGRIRWYGEESLDSRSVEAKVKEANHHYSIEFDTLGHIQDVELLVDWDELPRTSRDQICGILTDEFDRFRLKRIQTQWTGERTALQQQLLDSSRDSGLTTRYEIVVRGKIKGEVQWWEYLFSETGEEVRRSRIVFRNTDNLDY